MIAPGPRNSITDVAGLRVGQVADPALATGVTVILTQRRATAAVDVRGGGPGTRETDLLGLGMLVQEVDAVVLSGGSAFGLAAADGAMDWLAAAGRGFDAGAHRVPIVPAAVLFDLAPEMRWDTPPWRRLGREACAAAGADVALGSVGAGRGASVGLRALKGGIGTASVTDGRLTVGALAAVNPVGQVLIPGTRTFWAWWLEMAGELGGQTPPTAPPATPDPRPELPGSPNRENTTLAVVATDCGLDRQALARIAVMAQDGLARAVRPAHTPFDGDVIFALSTGTPRPSPPGEVAAIGALAADCLARAIMRGVFEATSLGGMPAYRDRADR